MPQPDVHPRIALVHATPLAMQPITDAFRTLWPEARLMHLLDDTLSSDRAAAGRLEEAMLLRFERLAAYALETGAEGILFTCSAFAPAIERVRAALQVPVLKPNEAMFDDALQAARAGSGTLGLVTTFAPAAASLREELLEEAQRRNIAVTLRDACAPTAMQALAEGDPERHDRLLLEAAAGLPRCDALLLGQFSMARAAPALRQALPGAPVLTSPHSAAARMRALLQV